MVEVVYLARSEDMPDVGDDKPWLIVAATSEGLFCGSGASWKPSGEWVGYLSLAENDVSLEAALTAAQEWAGKYGVPTMWVQLTP